MEFNMSGYWFVPAWVTSLVENNKMRYLRIPTGFIVNKVQRNRTLTDFDEGMASSLEKFSQNKTNMNTTVNILWFNKPPFINLTYANNVLKTECLYRNCLMEAEYTDIRKYSAIIYSTTDGISFKPPVPVLERDPNQVWIFFSLEPPIRQDYLAYRHNSWKNTMNWSMSYRLDADVFYPYGVLKKKKEAVERNYSSIFKHKTKMVAWLVSHCHAPSKRDQYVSELQQYGVDVKVYGLCGDERIHEEKEVFALLQRHYKFLLSFENSFCTDYISEKFFKYYNLDIVLVVRGGGDYDSVLPNDTFINSAHFESAKYLAAFILQVGNSEHLYSQYLERKSTYKSYDLSIRSKSYCSLCKKLNNLDENKRIYADHVTFIHNNTCWEPTDITFSKVGWTGLHTLGMVLISCVLVFCFVTTKSCLTTKKHRKQ